MENRKEYISPVAELIQLTTSNTILSLSYESDDQLQDNDQLVRRSRGEWGNIWSAK